MRGVKLDLKTAGKASFDFSRPAETAEALAQNASVLVVTKAGSSRVLPDKGTELQKSGARGLMFNLLSSQHALNFAALDILTTLRAAQDNNTPVADQINNVVIEASNYDVGRLSTNLVVTAQDGTTVGVTILD